MTLTPEERQRIYEEEKARIEARAQIEADAHRQAEAQQAEAAGSVAQLAPASTKGTHPLFLVALIVGAVIFISYVGASSLQDTTNTQVPLTVPTTPPPTPEEARRLLDEYHSLHTIPFPLRAQYDQMQRDLNLISLTNPASITGYDPRSGNALGLMGESPLGDPPPALSSEQSEEPAQTKSQTKQAAQKHPDANRHKARASAARDLEAQEDQAVYARIKAKLREDYPTSYSTQKMLFDANVEAYQYMKTVRDSELKARLEEDYPASYSTQKMLYDANIKDKQALEGD